MVWLAVFLGLIWGVIWAMVLQVAPVGRFLAQRRTYLTVVVGVGVDLVIMRLVVDLEAWLALCGVVAASGVGIIARSWWNEWRDNERLIEAWAQPKAEVVHGDEDQDRKQNGLGIG